MNAQASIRSSFFRCCSFFIYIELPTEFIAVCIRFVYLFCFVFRWRCWCSCFLPGFPRRAVRDSINRIVKTNTENMHMYTMKEWWRHSFAPKRNRWKDRRRSGLSERVCEHLTTYTFVDVQTNSEQVNSQAAQTNKQTNERTSERPTKWLHRFLYPFYSWISSKSPSFNCKPAIRPEWI